MIDYQLQDITDEFALVCESLIYDDNSDDLLLEGDGEGIISKIKEKIKKVFETISKFVMKYFNKLKEFLFGTAKEKKVTKEAIAKCNNILHDESAYQPVTDTVDQDPSKASKADMPTGNTYDTTTNKDGKVVVAKKNFLRSNGKKFARRMRLDPKRIFVVTVDTTIPLPKTFVLDEYVAKSKEIGKGMQSGIQKFIKRTAYNAGADLFSAKRPKQEDYEKWFEDAADAATVVFTDRRLDMKFIKDHFKEIGDVALGTTTKSAVDKYQSSLMKDIDALKRELENIKKRFDNVDVRQGLGAFGNASSRSDEIAAMLNFISKTVSRLVSSFSKEITMLYRSAIDIFTYVNNCAESINYARIREMAMIDEYYNNFAEFAELDIDSTILESNLDDAFLDDADLRNIQEEYYLVDLLNG
nr:MAG TPA: hypothetical protein [Bacteriophage sp.]